MRRAPVERVLVVEDNLTLATTLESALKHRFADVRRAASVKEARQRLDGWQPGLVLLDVVLPDGTALDVLDLLEGLVPAPAVVSISAEAEPEQAFKLAQRGVRIFLPKPVSLEGLERALKQALETAPDVEPHLRQVVGHQPLRAVEQQVRKVMVGEALGRAKGSLRGAAKLLNVSRQVLQHFLKRLR